MRTGVQRGRGHLEELEQSGNSARGRDGVDKYDGAAWVRGQQVVQHLVALLLAAVQARLRHLRHGQG